MVLVSFLLKAFIGLSNKKVENIEKKELFECGFNILTNYKTSFSTQFILIIILFLIFDLEIVLLIPSVVSDNFIAGSIILTLRFLFFITIATLME